MRARMVARLRASGYIRSERVAQAMLAVPRHEFVPADLREKAYADTPLHIGEGQTISAPHMVAIMLEALELRPGLKVLEVGCGSGYHAAVMAEMIRPGGKVYSIERLPSLVTMARRNLEAAGYADWVEVIEGDGTLGLPEQAPFDRISVAAAAPDIPAPLKEQLAEEGMMLVPVGGAFYQELILVVKRKGKLTTKNLGGCAFVPLVGRYGNKA
ncbi:MAG: protein-L-isoaspartate(D-aspartate) O-methyltransferase [Methanomassiliicoccales archaeon]